MTTKKQTNKNRPAPKFSRYEILDDQRCRELVDDDLLDGLVKLLKINPKESVSPYSRNPNHTINAREHLRNEIISVLLITDKPMASTSGALPKDQHRALDKIRRSLSSALKEIENLDYSKLDQTSGLALLTEKMRRESLKERQKPWRICRQAHGIDAVKNGEVRPSLFPFDDHLYRASDALGSLSQYLQYAKETIPEASRGRARSREMDELLLSLCWAYYSVTGKKIKATQTHDPYKKEEVTINGEIIDFLVKVLPHTSYGRRDTRGALEKCLRTLRTDALNPLSANSRSMWHCPEIWE